MRSSIAAAAAGLVLIIAGPAIGQATPDSKPTTKQDSKPAAPAAPAESAPADTAPPANAPMDIFTPPETKSPSEGWTDADKSADSIKLGQSFLSATQKAYAATGDLNQDIALDMASPQGKITQKMNVAFNKVNDLRLTATGIEVIVANGNAYVIPEQPADKFVEQAKAGSTMQTLEAAMPGFAMPTPTLAYREATAETDLAKPLGMGAVKNLRIVGARTGTDGVKQVLLLGDNGEAAVSIDPKTELIKGYSVQFSPEGLPPEIRMAFDVTLTDTVGPLAKPIVFEAGKRTKVASVADLFGGPGGGGESSEPETKIKEGDAAPLAALPLLDGTMVDLASMKGKVLVLDFWATWCGPCVKGLPLLQEFADKMKGNDKVAVFAVNSWENPGNNSPSDSDTAAALKKATDFWVKKKFTMSCLFDAKSELIAKYGFNGIPATVIIGPDGKLAATHVGFSPGMVDMLEADVKKALAGGNAAAAPKTADSSAGQ